MKQLAQLTHLPQVSLGSKVETLSTEIKYLHLWEEKFFKGQVPEKYRDKTLKDCDKQSPAKISYAKKWAKQPTSVIFTGSWGGGKTQLAFCMIREMFKYYPNSIWPRFFPSTNFDAELLKASKSDKGDMEFLSDRQNEDLLFIDDLGRETKSERLKRQYFELFNYRYNNKLPTIITTNYTLDTLSDIIDGSLASRMQEWTMVEFNGPDLRYQQQIV